MGDDKHQSRKLLGGVEQVPWGFVSGQVLFNIFILV